MRDPESRQAVEVAERYADGRAGRDELEAAYRTAQEVAARRLMPCHTASENDERELWSVWRLATSPRLPVLRAGRRTSSVSF